jgi:aspartate-semialdehyde dehydrogenase
MERMLEEGDFQGLEWQFFSTSAVGQPAPEVGVVTPPVADAHDMKALSTLDVILTCQGGGYTESMYTALRDSGWEGYWIDAASTMRMNDDALIALDPVNGRALERALGEGYKNFIGGNCTVSLLLMAIAGLFEKGWIEWVSSMTYQAASGAGARALKELVGQMHAIGRATSDLLSAPSVSILELDRQVAGTLSHDGDEALDTGVFGAPLAASLIPWIDRPVEGGQTREEWKGMAETNKILDLEPPIPVDGLCVRVGAMRCHSQAVTIKLTRDIPLDEGEDAISSANRWVEIVPNTKEATLARLSPAAITGTLDVPVGRLRKLLIGPEYVTLFTVGDQLLWGAAEPLRRMLRLIRSYTE